MDYCWEGGRQVFFHISRSVCWCSYTSSYTRSNISDYFLQAYCRLPVNCKRLQFCPHKFSITRKVIFLPPSVIVGLFINDSAKINGWILLFCPFLFHLLLFRLYSMYLNIHNSTNLLSLIFHSASIFIHPPSFPVQISPS